MKRIPIEQTINRTGENVKVAGWVNTVRSHGQLIFIDLRDRSGLLQVVFDPKNKELLASAQKLRPEWVIELEGKINQRPEKMVNPDLTTGQVEMKAETLKILSEAKPLPFPIDSGGYEISEEKRLKYRYLDLRRIRLSKNLRIRNEMIYLMRQLLKEKGFIEVETPILTKSTPEGARDFLVPSRLYPGNFYALPQSPQQYKQLLQVAGIEKYFQIARCLRDEDPRADRQPEFSQLDIEISFVEQEEILDLIEEMFVKIVKELFPQKRILKIPFPRIPYQEAIAKYGSDRPDIRENKNDSNELAFCFVIDFPLFEKTETKEIGSSHHPFTAPKDEDLALLDKEPMKARSWQHDFILNGSEVGGGSIRITNPEIQTKIFEILGHTGPEIKQKFGHLLEAFAYGVPPHGGIALGIERLLEKLLNEPNIREVIAFPKTGDSKDLMMSVPSEVDEKQLKELSLKLEKKKK